MLQHRLSRTERSRNKSGSPFQHRVHGIDDPNTRFHLPERTWFIHIRIATFTGHFCTIVTLISFPVRDLSIRQSYPKSLFPCQDYETTVYSPSSLKRNHNLMIQPVFPSHFEPIGSFHLIPGFGQRRSSILSSSKDLYILLFSKKHLSFYPIVL